ncbi:MAG: fructose-6-phosphate aldolase [Bacteroidota bacterium]
MFILKIQGTKKIPDFIQIRDENFTLIAYFKITNPKTALTRCNLLHRMEDILRIANGMGYGKIQRLEMEAPLD